jgi:hypothetical protein
MKKKFWFRILLVCFVTISNVDNAKMDSLSPRLFRVQDGVHRGVHLRQGAARRRVQVHGQAPVQDSARPARAKRRTLFGGIFKNLEDGHRLQVVLLRGAASDEQHGVLFS